MSKSYRPLVRGLFAAFAFGLINQSARAGDVVGRISDAKTGDYIVGASVTDPATGRNTVTDREGRFTLADLPAGGAALQVDSIGYDSLTQNVDVPGSGSVTADVNMNSDVIQLGALVVEGQRQGRAKALQQKRTAINVQDIISADSVGNLPDRNVAEALSRVAGISLSVDGGEGQFVSIRGVEPNLNNVTFNGTTVAPPGVNGRTGRATELDIIAASQISQIEVIKSVTPDMDGNSLGGTINIKTVSAFDRKTQFIYGGFDTGYNDQRNDGTAYDADFTFGNVFGEHRTLGVAFAASYTNRPYINDNVQASWDADPASGVYYPSRFEYHPEIGTRKRLGLNLNLEYRPDDTLQVFLRGIYNKFNKDYIRDEILTEARRDPVFISPTKVSFDRERYELRQFKQKSDQSLVNLTPGFSKTLGDFTVEGQATYSHSKEYQDPNNSVGFRTGNVNVPQLVTADFSNFLIDFDDRGSLSAASTVHPLRRYRVETSLVEETTYTPQVDLKRDFNNWFGGRSGFLKFGGKFYHRHRLVDDNSLRPTNGNLTIDQIGARGPALTFFDGQYTTPITVDYDKGFAYLAANPANFTIDQAESQANSAEDDFDITEKITALYGMVSVDINSRLTAMTGLRFEHTDAVVGAKQARTVDGDFVGIFPEEGGTTYDTYMPNLQLRFTTSKQSVFRFAYNRTLGRPAYEDAAPISTLEVDTILDPLDPAYPYSGSLDIGNPQLKPFISDNFDLGYEYYLKSGGVLSAGVFRKEIKNPIYKFGETRKAQNINGYAIESLDVSQTRNADSGRISGVEFNVQVPFSSFLGAGVLSGFGVDLNATFISSSVKVPGRESEDLPFFRQPDRIYNAALYYQKGKITARAAYNYQTDSITLLGGDSKEAGSQDEYQADRYFIDLQASYKLTDKFSIFANWKNITNEKNDTWIGAKYRLRQSYDYGSDIRVGMRFNF